MKILILSVALILSAQVMAKNPPTSRGYILKSIPSSKNYASKYLNRIWDDVEWCSKKYNVPMSLLLAEMCLKSDFGRNVKAKRSNNHLGITFEEKLAEFASIRNCLDIYGKALSQEKFTKFEVQSASGWLYLLDTYGYNNRGDASKTKKIIARYNLKIVD